MSGTPLARPSVWRLCWSFTWRQAAAMIFSMIVLGLSLAILQWAGVPNGRLYDAIPYLTFVLVVYSSWEACRYLLSAYDIRLHGAHADEQNHRHRR
jgi:uncharacterized membrane protein YoaT (DUF817 family)